MATVTICDVYEPYWRRLPCSPAVPVDSEYIVLFSSDDAQESLTTNIMSLSTIFQSLGTTSGAIPQAVGFRFTDIAIPPSSVILSARIQFTSRNTSSSVTELAISCEASDSGLTFVNVNSNITSRTLTGISVPWSVDPWPVSSESGPAQLSPDLSSIVQLVVDRPGWLSLSSLVFIIVGSGGRFPYAFEGDTLNVARLIVTHI